MTSSTFGQPANAPVHDLHSVPDLTPDRVDNYPTLEVNSLPWTFGVELDFAAGRVVLRVCGSVDLLTAPELRSILTALVDQGHRSLVLDLVKLDFIDASGVRVIADCSLRLRLSGGNLVIQSPTAIMRRVLEITGLTSLVSGSATPTPAD